MPEQPITITEHDVKEPNLLLRGLRKVTDRLIYLGNRLSAVENAPRPPGLGEIKRALEASGSHPLYIGNLLGQAAEPQIASADIYPTDPTGVVLQQLRDEQLIMVGTTSTGFALKLVRGGNPNTLYTLVTGLSTGNFVTVDTTQTVTGEKTLGDGTTLVRLSLNGAATFIRALRFQTAAVNRWQIQGANADAESGSNAGSNFAVVAFNDTGGTIGTALSITRSDMGFAFGGQINSGVQYAGSVYLNTAVTGVTTGPYTVPWDTTSVNQGSVVTGTSSTRLHAKGTGVYIVGGQVTMSAATSTAAGSFRVVNVMQNGATPITGAQLPLGVITATTVVVSPKIINLTATDYVELTVEHNITGGSLAIGGGTATTFYLYKLC